MRWMPGMIDRLTGREAELTGECAKLRAERDRLKSSLAQLWGTTPEGVMDPPEFVLIGIDRKGAGKRLIASRDLPGAALGMTAMDDPPPRFQIRAVLARTLFIDKPTYSEAMARMAEIWRNWDRDERAGDTRVTDRHRRLERGQPQIDPPMPREGFIP